MHDNVRYLPLVLSNVALNIIAQILLKIGMMNTGKVRFSLCNLFQYFFSVYVLLGVVFYVISLFLWLYLLSKIELSFAYPFLSIAFCVIMFVGWLFFNETMNAYKLIATMMIVGGVSLLYFGY